MRPPSAAAEGEGGAGAARAAAAVSGRVPSGARLVGAARRGANQVLDPTRTLRGLSVHSISLLPSQPSAGPTLKVVCSSSRMAAPWSRIAASCAERDGRVGLPVEADGGAAFLGGLSAAISSFARRRDGWSAATGAGAGWSTGCGSARGGVGGAASGGGAGGGAAFALGGCATRGAARWPADLAG